MLNSEIKQAVSTPRKKPSSRSYVRLNIASFSAVALLSGFVSFEVATNIGQHLDATQTASSSANSGQSNMITLPPSDDSSNNSSNDNSGNNYFDNNNGFDNNGFQDNSGGFSGGVQVNPPSFNVPHSGHS